MVVSSHINTLRQILFHMSALMTFHKNNIRKWILLRMAASEFYYKQPFDIKEEFPIMTSIMGFAISPILLIFAFLYARIYGSLARYNLLLIPAMFIICFGIAYIIIRSIKNDPLIEETIHNYESMNIETRKKNYSFKNGFKLTFIMTILPWIILGLALAIICYAVPLSHNT